MGIPDATLAVAEVGRLVLSVIGDRHPLAEFPVAIVRAPDFVFAIERLRLAKPLRIVKRFLLMRRCWRSDMIRLRSGWRVSANRSPGGPYRYVFYRFLTGALAPPPLMLSGKAGQCDSINLI